MFSLNIDEGEIGENCWIIICCCYCLLNPGASSPDPGWLVKGYVSKHQTTWIKTTWGGMNTRLQFPRSCSNIRKWFVTGGNMLVIVHNIAVRKLLFTTNSLTFGPLLLLEVDPHPHEWRNLEDKWSVTSRLIEPIYPSILSQWIYRLSVQTQSHKSLNSDSFMFVDPLMRVGHKVQGKAEDESLYWPLGRLDQALMTPSQGTS